MMNIKKGEVIIFIADAGEIKKGTMGRVVDVQYSTRKNQDNYISYGGQVCGGFTQQGRMFISSARLVFKDGSAWHMDANQLNKIRKADKQERFLFEMGGRDIISDGIC